ncbi:hypothetical protein BC830DRAFT_1077860 [Chytriomyces sp. MP71]|nr:hypothetical protein BC830DRAFT_1077860 [Chytriomyces sp. MP71]
MAIPSPHQLAQLPIITCLAALRGIANRSDRLSVTQATHARLASQWRRNPNFVRSNAAQLVDGVHAHFRHCFSALSKENGNGDDTIRRFVAFSNELNLHHAIEDGVWFPRLARFHTELQLELLLLEDDHRAFVALESRIEEGDTLALREFIENLNDHMDREEMITVPFLMDGTGGL